MALARMSVSVGEDAPLRPHRFVSAAGEPVAWLNVGDAGELNVYGSPAALRRLGEARWRRLSGRRAATGTGGLRVVDGS